MKDFNINDYSDDLLKLCDNCKKFNKCKDHKVICLRKKLVFNIASQVYKKRLKEGKQ